MIRQHLAAWCLLVPIAVTNGWLREKSYGRWLGELTAHQLSTLSLMLMSGLLACLVARHWPLTKRRSTWLVGAAWLLLTLAFEFGFGRLVMDHSWERLWHDYDLAAGRLWTLFLVWLFVLPNLCHRLRYH